MFCCRARNNVGDYDVKDTKKLTVMLGIEAGDPRLPDNLTGSIARPRRWIRIRRVVAVTDVTTTGDNFASIL